MGQQLFIVHGVVGEYSAREEWVVAAYADETLAKAHILNATQRSNEWLSLPDDDQEKMIWGADDSDSYRTILPHWSIWDERFGVYQSEECSAPTYYLTSITLSDALPAR